MISVDVISKIGVEEKYIRDEHYNSIKVWWARRPIRAMRAIIINEVLQIRSSETKPLPEELIHSLNPTSKIFEQFSEVYKTNELTLLDVFGGGGSIPFESARLGLKTYSSELNPVASLLQETIFNSFNKKNFADVLEKEALKIIEETQNKLSKYYLINGITPYTIFWSKTIECKNCGKETNLSRLKYLSKRKGKEITIPNESEVSSNDFTCRHCQNSISFRDIKDYCKNQKLGFQPLAFVFHNEKTKTFQTVDEETRNVINKLQKEAKKELNRLSKLIPKDFVEAKNGVINPTLYDLKKPEDFYNSTQLLCLLTLIDSIINDYPRLKKTYGDDFSKQLILSFTSMIEFLVDWNSTGTMWISQNEQTGRSLAGPGVGMKWDFIEINPFYKTGSNLRSKIKRVCKTFRAIYTNAEVNILKGSSTNLNLQDESIDMVITDPPYYDSIDYTGLSEFFRPWFEILSRNTFDKNADYKNDTTKEAIVQLSKGNKIHPKRGDNHYYQLMRDIFIESKRVLKPDGRLVFVYGHKTLEGWEVIAKSIKDAGLFITEVYPVDMERAARPRGMSYQSLNGVIVFELQKHFEGSLELNLLFKNISTFNTTYIPIYLASLACLLYVNSDINFHIAYDNIVSHHRESFNSKIDVTKKEYDIFNTYLSLVKCGSVNDLEEIQKIIALKYQMCDVSGKPLPLDHLDTSTIDSEDIIQELITLYKTVGDESSIKINLDDESREIANHFFGELSDIDLNTVNKRTFNKGKKIARLIVSKLNVN
jgi:putative DNA methylase